MRAKTLTLAVLTLTLASAAPAGAQQMGGDGATMEAQHATAEAELKDTDGRTVGHVQLEETPLLGVLITVEVEGLDPGLHGFHIHETGSCEAADFTSAGGHFAPRGNAHGLWSPGGMHGGDMLNLRVGEDGRAAAERLAGGVTLRDGVANSLFDHDGSAFIVHDGADDYESQPSGAAGPRVACGVIRH